MNVLDSPGAREYARRLKEFYDRAEAADEAHGRILLGRNAYLERVARTFTFPQDQYLT